LFFRLLAIALIAGFTSSFTYAIGIGEITLHSYFGEPLRAEVDLLLEKGDLLDDKCLSLTEAENAGGFLPTDLTAKLDSSGHKVEIRSRKSFNELFAVFRLRIKCSDNGSVSKTLTVLPEISPISSPLVAVEPVKSSTPVLQSEARFSEQHAAADEISNKSASQEKLPVTEPSASAPPGRKSAKRSGGVRKNRNAQFSLKLSVGQLDMARIGTITAEQHDSLLAQRKLMDEDDQTAHFLAMQHQLKLMQDELGAMKLKLVTLESAASAVVNVPRAAAPAVAPLPNNQKWDWMLIALGLVVAAFVAWLGFRYFGRTNYQTSKVFSHEEDNLVIPERSVSKPIIVAKTPVEPEIKPAETTNVVLPETQPKTQPEMQPEMQPEIYPADGRTDGEENSVVEEAELYVEYGHPEKGIKILQEYVAQHPQSEKSWTLLLSIFSSHGQADEFETTVRAFLQHNINSPAWEEIQALGRAVDEQNPLYFDEKNQGASISKPPLNETLLEQQASAAQIAEEKPYKN
jgi:hypothetical protein